MHILYLDVLFIINWIMDSMIFLIATLILNKSLKLLRLLLGSFFAALLYCLVICLPFLQDIPSLVYTVLLPSLPILYLFRPHHIKGFIKIYLLCQGIAFLLGGTTFSLWYILGMEGSVQDVNLLFLVGVAGILAFSIYLSFYSIRKYWVLPYFEYKVEFIHQGKKGEFTAIVDTGNTLYTPITHKAVIVVDYEPLEPLLSEEERIFIMKFTDKRSGQIWDSIPQGISLIPFNSVGCKGGFLVGVEMEEVHVYKQNKVQCFEKCAVGVSTHPIFSDKSYTTLLHPDFIVNRGN